MPLKMYGQNPIEDPLKEVKHVIGILGGKGGVGKSTVTVNLALALKALGRRVGILDADIYGPSTRHLLGGGELPTEREGQIYPAKARGIELISVAFFRKGEEASIVRAPIANQIIRQFLEKIQWGALDDLLLDFPPGTGDIQITLMQRAGIDGCVAVTTPQELALLDVRKSIQMCHQMGVPILGVIENMSYFLHQNERYALFGEGGGKLLADESQVPLLGQIPIDPKLSEVGDEGGSLFETEGISRLSFEELATRLISRLKVVGET